MSQSYFEKQDMQQIVGNLVITDVILDSYGGKRYLLAYDKEGVNTPIQIPGPFLKIVKSSLNSDPYTLSITPCENHEGMAEEFETMLNEITSKVETVKVELRGKVQPFFKVSKRDEKKYGAMKMYTTNSTPKVVTTNLFDTEGNSLEWDDKIVKKGGVVIAPFVRVESVYQLPNKKAYLQLKISEAVVTLRKRRKTSLDLGMIKQLMELNI